jgi:hypothetical protein
MTEKKNQPELAAVSTEKQEDNGLDISNLSEIRAPQDFNVEVKKVWVHIPVGRPPKQEFIRVRSGDQWCETLGLYEKRSEWGRETYVVMPNMYEILTGEFSIYKVLLAVTRRDKPYIWPIKLPGADGRHNTWHSTALEAAEIAKKKWLRLQSNQDVGAYDVLVAENQNFDPRWPDLNFLDLINIAFKGRIIKDPDHQIIHELRGVL